MCEKEHCDKECGNYPRAELDFLNITAENADYDVGDKSECDSVRDVVGERH